MGRWFSNHSLRFLTFRCSLGCRTYFSVYQQVTGWESFEPTLSRAKQADLDCLWEIAEGLPEEWWNQMFSSDLTKLIKTLYQPGAPSLRSKGGRLDLLNGNDRSAQGVYLFWLPSLAIRFEKS